MAREYADVLSTSWSDMPEPKLLPDGSWRLRANGASYQPAKDDDGSPSVLFVYRPMEPMEDVDLGELEKLGDGYDPQMNRIFKRFYINDASDWKRVKDHVVKHGVQINPAESIGETLKAVRNKDIIGYVTSKSFQTNDGTPREENDVQTFAPIEE